MLIPSIDLMGGKAVQLRQGKKHILTSERDPIDLAREFNRYGEVAVIDLDAALGKGDNLELIRSICRVADVRAGGGIRTVERGRKLLRAGAKCLIVGTAAEPAFLGHFVPEKVMVALDHLSNDEVLDKGWQGRTGEGLFDRARRLSQYCGGFLCTFVENEGMMSGMTVEPVKRLQQHLDRPITVAGGVRDTDNAVEICRQGVDVQVGMALYTGAIDPVEVAVKSLAFDQAGLIPTIVQDRSGQVLMLAYNSQDSLREALRSGSGVYFSRSRQSRWKKGETSGHTQRLVACRPDCDRDSILFVVEQEGVACHRNSYSCFGSGLRSFSLQELEAVLAQRKRDLPAGSYSARLFANRGKLVRKVMEEAFEVATAHGREELVWEIADLLFHSLLLAVAEGVTWEDIVNELAGRHRQPSGKS